MKKKKLLSALLAGALMVSTLPMQVFAAPGNVGSADANSGAVEGDVTVGSSAFLKVVVPLEFDFVINPLELSVNGSTEQIISAPYTFINKSNMDVQLSVTPQVATDSSLITIANSPDEIKNVVGESPTIYLEMIPAATKPALKVDPSRGVLADLTAAAPAFTTDAGVKVDNTSSAFFKLENLKEAYSSDGTNMQYDKDLETTSNVDAIALRLTGKVSQMSDWTAINSFTTEIKYKFDYITTDAYSNTDKDVANTHGMVSASLLGPTFGLQSNGKFSILGLPDGYQATGLFFMLDENEITVTSSDVATAMGDNPLLSVGLNVGNHSILQMNPGVQFDGLSTSTQVDKHFELKDTAKSTVSGKHFVVLTVLTKTNADPILIMSKDVLMD